MSSTPFKLCGLDGRIISCMSTRRFIYSLFGCFAFHASGVAKIQCCLPGINRPCRSDALHVRDGCDLSFQCCSLAADQQLVESGGRVKCNSWCFFMMQPQHKAGKRSSSPAVSFIWLLFTRQFNLWARDTAHVGVVYKQDGCRTTAGAQSFV